MRSVILVLVLLLAAAALLFGPSLFRSDDPVTAPPGAGGKPPTEGPNLQGQTPEPVKPADDSPQQEPPPEMLLVERPLKVLVLMTSPGQRWARVLELAAASDPQIVMSGYAVRTGAGMPPFGTGEPPPGGSAPTAAWFDAQAFDVVALCDMDPNVIEPAFWEAVAGRVRAGTLGLWLQPGVPMPPDGGSRSPEEHPLLKHAVLSTVSPVESAKAVKGDPTPGVFVRSAVFQLTADGEKHPASRIVMWPEWSRRIWQLGASATPPWSSKFVYPVERLAAGSVVLVEAQPPGNAPRLPMYVQGPPSRGRVLWFGAQQIEDDTLRDGRQATKWYAMLHNALVWLAGRAP
jgi:hypothetical protein